MQNIDGETLSHQKPSVNKTNYLEMGNGMPPLSKCSSLIELWGFLPSEVIKFVNYSTLFFFSIIFANKTNISCCKYNYSVNNLILL